MLMVFTGNGKGKTTAAIGQAIRALGQGKRVFMIQFIKSPRYPSGEDTILPKFAPRLHFEKGGLGFVGILGDKLPFEKHEAAASRALMRARKAMLGGSYDMIILDEVNVAVDLKLLPLNKLLSFLNDVPPTVDIIVTGRYAHSEVLLRAELVTSFDEACHPYQSNVPARRGIEY